jgi:hypothetical protein
MSRYAVVIPLSRARRPKAAFSLSAICDDAERSEQRSSRLLAACVATSFALLGVLQLVAMQ